MTDHLRSVNDGPQLSFRVDQHPDASARTDGGWLDGEVKVAGSFAVDRDLQPGEQFTVQIADADGEIIASGTCSMEGGPSFPAVKLDGKVVGLCRSHKIKVA